MLTHSVKNHLGHHRPFQQAVLGILVKVLLLKEIEVLLGVFVFDSMFDPDHHLVVVVVHTHHHGGRMVSSHQCAFSFVGFDQGILLVGVHVEVLGPLMKHSASTL